VKLPRAARMLRLSESQVRNLVDLQVLACQWTRDREPVLLFREREVLRLVERRATARGRQVPETPPRSVPIGDARQLALFGTARLRLVPLRRDDSEGLQRLATDPSRSLRNASESHTRSYVNRR